MSNNDDNDKKKIKGIDKARRSTSIKQVDSVDDVKKVEKTKGIKGVGKTKAASATSSTQALQFQQREKLLNMVEEEAKKMFGKSSIPKDKQEIIKRAVQMAIDAAIIPEDGEETNSSSENT